MIITCLLCGRQEQHEARGLGHSCYQKALNFGMLGAFPKHQRRPVQDRTTYWREYKRRKAAERRTNDE